MTKKKSQKNIFKKLLNKNLNNSNHNVCFNIIFKNLTLIIKNNLKKPIEKKNVIR